MSKEFNAGELGKTSLELLDCREKINQVDEKILRFLRERFILVRRIAELKKQSDLSIVDISREKELYEMYEKLAQELGLDPDFVQQIFGLIINESKRLQK